MRKQYYLQLGANKQLTECSIQENRTNVYEIHFDGRLVDQMIEFIYSGDYASYTNDRPELGSTKSGQDLPMFLPPFLYHVRIALLADIYQVDKLRYLAAARARAVLKNDHCLWSDILLRQMKVSSIWQRLERRASMIVKNAQSIETYLVTALDNPDWPHLPPERVALLTERTHGLTTKLEKWEELRQNRVPLDKMTAKSREKQEGFRIEEDNVIRQVRETIKEIEEHCRTFQGSWWDLIEVALPGIN
ncbi:hypothetical protein KEM56_006109 [Ascosphaera pollenicola]|nr:hypothetical protein KEM56_006109 [Ascosphaera pollenicola]